MTTVQCRESLQDALCPSLVIIRIDQRLITVPSPVLLETPTTSIMDPARTRKKLLVCAPFSHHSVKEENPRRCESFYEHAKGETTEGSLDWFLKHKQYTEWLNRDSGVFRVFGGLRKGKSMIALHVLDVLERHTESPKFPFTAPSKPIWHFYDTQASVAHATSSNMIKSFIFQLLRAYDDLF